jgi:type VI secretion system secreted protein VgrG
MSKFIDPTANLNALINRRQTRRLLKLSFPKDDGPAAMMVVNQLDAHEGMSRDFRLTDAGVGRKSGAPSATFDPAA